jgi:uncharacterized protein YkwD
MWKKGVENVRTGIKCLTALLLVALCFSTEMRAQDDVNARHIGWFTNHTAESFRELKAAQEKIQPERINRDLLDAAVFHETNRRREQHGLPALAHHDGARQAARMQSEAMAKHQFVAHDNPFEAKLKTLPDRARRAGLKPRFIAENVASAFARQYESGKRFYVRAENGKQILSVKPDGPPIPMRTYVEFANALLDDWMSSPGHRENILHKSAQYLGCACVPGIDDTSMEKIYCTQVFFTPQAE